MTKVIIKRHMSIGLDRKNSVLKGVEKHKRKYIRKKVKPEDEVDVPEDQADYFVAKGWAKFPKGGSSEKKKPPKVITADTMKGKTQS